MTLKRLISSCMIIFIYPLSVNAEEINNSFFVHFDGGVSLSRNLKGSYIRHMGNSGVFGAGAKYQMAPKVKLGANLLYRPRYTYNRTYAIGNIYAAHHQKLNITTLMLNASYDIIEIANKVTPYIEIGVGISRINLGTFNVSTTEHGTLSDTDGKVFHNLSVAGGLGAAFKVDDKTFIDLNYRYNDFGKVRQFTLQGESEFGRLAANEFLVSLRIKI